ncbi:hypothetical protein [uncultured Alsobacter sp.]|uniref:hypothetical protein n=1 Tax=uncultured Alsobacter sp. TaxID=1748258 RepID=UPI0025CEA4DF|nr:hypothetical protein [uncultured Alsobacter sp.]
MRALFTAGLLLALAATPVLAGASSSNFPPQPDPDTKAMKRADAKLYVAQGCERQWAKSSGLEASALNSACSCYAGRTVDRMTKAEFAFFQEKSYFDDTTREKALKAVDACKLPRPSI